LNQRRAATKSPDITIRSHCNNNRKESLSGPPYFRASLSFGYISLIYNEFHIQGGLMSRALIETNELAAVKLGPAPIEPSWIIDGHPVAQCCVLSRSDDGLASTILWECSEGRFNWYYDFDETIMILEGSIVLQSDTMPATRYGAGDVIFFRDGAHARWHVEGRVRKLAFCRKAQPAWLGFAVRVFLKLRKIILPPGERQAASLMSSS
jgi:uncharacterized cupin superfamily protein